MMVVTIEMVVVMKVMVIMMYDDDGDPGGDGHVS
jgi:hypothetical protein